MKKALFLILVLSVLFTVPVFSQETGENGTGPETEIMRTEETERESSTAMDEETIERILDDLGREEFRTTRQKLKDGEVIASGYKGDAGAGLQRMLVDFGCDITIDGAVGAKTMEALHKVQESFGLEETEEVDLTVFDTLLPLLLLSKHEETTDVDLYGFYEASGGEGYYDYLKGCALAAQGRYYSAKQAFEDCAYGDSEQRAESCVQDFPENGEVWHNPEIVGSDSSLTFTVNSSDESKGMCFQMFDTEDRLVSVLFIKGTGSATAYVPVGTYHIMDGVGYEWYGPADTFGEYGYYEYLTFTDDEDTRYDAVLDYGQYELTINVEQIEEGATSVGSTSVPWNAAGWDE